MPIFTRRALPLYLLLLILFSAPFDVLLIRAAKIDAVHGFVIHGEMWAPGIAAILACVLSRTPIAALGWRWPAGRWMAWGYALPIGYALLTYLILWATGLAPLDLAAYAKTSAPLGIGPAGAVLAVILTLSYGVIQSAASATGEEIGWRGLLAPALAERMSFGAMVVISGLIWAAWHMPLILFADYNSGAPWWVAVACFTLMIVSTGALSAWLRLKSGSFWPAALLHACHNAVIQWVLDPMTVETGRAAWFAGEFGIVLALVSAVVAAIVIGRDRAGRDHRAA
jgi:membrane protease YdiL (CAAX protease family)